MPRAHDELNIWFKVFAIDSTQVEMFGLEKRNYRRFQPFLKSLTPERFELHLIPVRFNFKNRFSTTWSVSDTNLFTMCQRQWPKILRSILVVPFPCLDELWDHNLFPLSMFSWLLKQNGHNVFERKVRSLIYKSIFSTFLVKNLPLIINLLIYKTF